MSAELVGDNPPAVKKQRKQKKSDEGDDVVKAPVEPKKKKVASDANLAAAIPRVATPSPYTPKSGDKALTVAVWNVAGLRAQFKNHPEAMKAAVLEMSPDILCMQEHKLQDSHVPEYLNSIDGYSSFWICSRTTKGYSGVATFVKNSIVGIAEDVVMTRPELGVSSVRKATGSEKKLVTLRGVTWDISSDSRLSGEGRTITLEFDTFFIVNCYVPNAGQGLKRIDFRCSEWDPALRTYLDSLKSKGKSVVLAGDLNCAHRDIDVYNAGASHLKKQPGCTAQERAGFDQLIAAGYVDSFRHFYPEATGQYTFWSGMNVVARPENKGLRLDYFLTSQDLLGGSTTRVVDSQICHDIAVGSCDHCPILLTMLV
jgi:exodeoxyribonuclease III